MSGRIPTTDELRDLWRRQRFWETGVKSNHDGSHPAHAEFDAWIAEMRRQVAEEAWDEGYSRGNAHNGRRDDCPYRAAEIREGEGNAGV